MCCKLFIDYSNFNWSKIFFEDLLKEIFMQFASRGKQILTFDVRLYGGWYSEGLVTDQRTQAILMVNTWPNITKFENIVVRIKYSFADQVLSNYSDPIFDVRNTYVRRQELFPRFKFVFSNDCKCKKCKIEEVRSWFKSGKACFETTCRKGASDVLVRFEQKQVDTHLLADLMSAVFLLKDECFGLVSSDADFIPGLQVFIAQNNQDKIVVLKSPKVKWFNESELARNHLTILNLESLRN